MVLPYLNVAGDQIKKLMYSQDVSHASPACFLEAFILLATSLQLCLAPQLQSLSAPFNSCSLSPLWQLTLHDPFHHSFWRAVSMALIFVPFPVETKISGNSMPPKSSRGNWSYPVSSFALPIRSHWIQQVTYLQTDGPAPPPSAFTE